VATPPVTEPQPQPLPTASPRRLTVRSRRLRISARISARTTVVGTVAAALAVLVAAVTMTLGDFPVPLPDVLASTFGVGAADPAYDFVVRELRLPRALAAALAGAALAASGAIFQGLVRNPLVAPDIIGINAGASLVAVYLIVITGSVAMVPAGAFVGAVVTAFAVYALTWRTGISGNRLVIVGIGVNAVLASLTTLVLVRYPVEQIAPAVLWTTGTVYGAHWGDLAVLTVGLGVMLPAAVWCTRYLTALQLGEETARSLGVRVEPARAALITVGAGLAATAVAVAGPIGFVALIAPHIARMLAGPLTAGVLVVSALVGAVMLGVSDLVAQHAFAVSLPVGVVTAAVGAPYFLFLLYRSNRLT
jgi:iron complex transport system permease protein